MHPLLSNVLPHMVVELPAFRMYVVCLAIWMVTLAALAILTVRARMRGGVSVNPEDARPGLAVADSEHPDVLRVQRAHRNALENIPMFAVISLVAVLSGCHTATVQVCMVIFTVARVTHAVGYLSASPKLRSPGQMLGLVTTLVLLGVVIVHAFS